MVEACLAGGEDAWEELVCRYGPLVFSIPRHYGLDQDVCEDIFQEVFSILIGQLRRIRSRTGLPKWFITTTHRVCCQWFRRSQRSANAEPPVMDGPAPPPEHVMRWERHQLVRQALRRLGGRCEELLLALYSNQGPDSYEHVARQLEIPVGSIGPTRARCLQKLMEILAAMEAEEPA
ncbi:MAG: RNA polymerase sigma factor [Planctomycetota bacterium]